MSTAATASPSFQHAFPAVLPSSASTSSTVPTPTASVTSSPSVLPFHRRQLPATPIHTSQLPIPNSTATYSPLSSGLPSPNFPSPIPLPAVLPSIPTSGGVGIGIGRGRSPAPSVASSRQPSRQQSIRRLSSLSGAFSPIVGPAGGHGRRPSHATSAYPLPDVNDFSTIHEDILSEGDVIGVGDELHGEVIELVDIPTSAPRPEQDPPAARLEVVGKLGAGSYAVVYLVKEIVSRTPIERPASPKSLDGDLSMMSDSSDDSRPRYRYTYGREFAVKCLAKGNLSPEELEIQMFEARVHQSLPTHPNIVTLYRTLQTPSFLLLVLESVPGQDLYYFLEQSRDHAHFVSDSVTDPLSVQPSRTPSRSTSTRPLPPVPGSQLLSPTSPTTSNGLLGNALMITSTPPTPSLLSTLHPQHQFSYQRLRLITSMFSQMCDAVDACHSRGVSHRDIKPENFIVTEGLREGGGAERKVIVKLSDFGLATMLQESADVDCGSAPYMSYECRNNVAPTYATQPADVWSLGIVLINMLYHHNPWSDTATFATQTADYHRHSSLPSGAYPTPGGIQQQYICPSFQAFLANPVQFFLQRFPSMTMPVADFLANRVFCILPRPNILDASGMPKYKNIGQRCTAREFGEWIKSLPLLMGQGSNMVMGLGMGASGGPGSSRNGPTQRMGSRLAIESWMNEDEDALHVPSVTPMPAASTATLVVAEEPVLAPAHSLREGSKATEILSTSPADAEASGHSGPGEGDADNDGQDSIRSPSTKRRGKRGARRKDKSLPPSTPSQNPSFNSLLDLSSAAGVPPVPTGLPTAADVENLASEISRSTAPVLRSSASRTSVTSGRSTGRSRLSTTEKLVARLPPPPSMAPPAPPVEGVTVKKYQEAGRRISMEEQEAARSGSPRPPSVISQTGSSVRSVPISIQSANGKGSINKQRGAPPSPPTLFSPLHHYRPNPPKDAPPKPPVATPASAFAQQHPGAAAILSSQPALPSKKSWMGRLLSSNSTTNSPPPAAHAAPGAHQSPATLSSAASTASMSRSSLASSTMESAARSGLLVRENSPVRSTGPGGTIRAPSRASAHHNPGMQWDSHEDDLAPRVNDLAVMPPPASATWRRNPPPGAQWSTSEDPSARAAPAARSPPVHGFISSAVAFNAEQNQPHRRKMDSNWRSSVMSNATTASSGAGSISNSAGTLSSASSMYTRFSNSSVRSVSTTATSASAMSKWGAVTEKPGAGADAPSWRPTGPPVTGVDSGFVGPDAPPRPRKAPMQKSNVKRMDGIPWELDEFPGRYQPRVKGVLPDMPNKKPGYAQQQMRGQRSSPPLDPISEKNNSTSQSPPPSPDAYRNREGATSTTDLDPTLDGSSTSTDPRSSPDLKKQVSQKSQSHGFQKFSLFKPKQRD